MTTRRQFLRLGAAAAAAVPLAGVAGLTTRDRASAATTLPLTIVNNTGAYASTAIWLYIVGVAPNNQQAYVRADGTLVPVTPSLNGPDGYADLSIPLNGSGNTTINLPNMSGRVYFSVNNKLKFRVVTDGSGNNALQYPAGWVSSDPSYTVLHDWIEFTFAPSGMYCNTTMVDMFSVPLAIHLVGASDQTTGTLVSGGRDAIFAGIAAQPDFKNLIVGNNLRVIAPGHGIDAGLFSPTYLDSYITNTWNTYTNTNLTVSVNGTSYPGRVSGGSLTFSGVGSFAKPRTQDVFYCAGALAPPAGTAGAIAAVLGAAFNRTTILANPNQPVTNPGQFYQPAVTNHYARVMHQNTVDGKAYGFPFDDVSGFAAYVQDGAPTAMTVTLTPFSGTGGGTPRLLSAGRPATSSSVESSAYPPSNAVDGNLNTRWSSAFSDPQWLQVDLGASYSVTRAVLTWEAAYATAFQIQTSPDGVNWSTVWSTSSGTGGTTDVTFPASSGRYVRVYGTKRATPYGYSLWEAQFYGT